jgi:poly(A) polymerase
MREMLALQPRFPTIRGKRAAKLLEHRRFRAAYDFMLLQSEVGLADEALARFWTDVQTQSAAERAESFQMQAGPGKKRRPRKRKRKSSPSA